MILGVDGGTATSGWAHVDEATLSIADLGVLIQPALEGEGKVAGRIRRGFAFAHVIAARAPGCHAIAVEHLNLGMPGALGKVSVGLAWGCVLGVVAMCSPVPKLLAIAPQRWQREVLPDSGRQVDYDELYAQAMAYIRCNHPHAAALLAAMHPDHRNHAIDAAMIALCAALRPERCDVITLVAALQPKKRRRA